MEDTFKRCIEVAEKSQMRLDQSGDQTKNVFMW
jgi:tetratricopeptide (TPR) repeat protein